MFIGAVIQKIGAGNKSSSSTNTTTSIQSDTSTTSVFTLEQIATHSTKDDCWLIIDSSVYNVSDYLAEHPGGVSVVSPFCGKDATQAFETMGGRGAHSSAADQIKQKYIVGTVSN